ncbi:hypothetical protein [Ancylobacter oerskovii]|uniref:Uncharacterized protein n=1 Tax=Ancylobacter oerskovii TaxID=459519 RepID=A0ABW4YVX4_9HYPH|nr:hypothetical protein [Ancylobacter oerskovii]MBS7543134.1 hypothetical protein [Ancylobacter oerskovii]
MSTAPQNNPSPPATYTLYFTGLSSDDPLQPMKRLRFSTIPDAVDRALEMKREGKLKPVEVRDQQGRLVTCELIGWRFSPLATRSAAPERSDTRWRYTA